MSDLPARILLATDGSEDAALAARVAVELSREAGAELHVVHAWQTVPSPHFESWINSALEREAREVLDGQTKKIRDSGGDISEAYLKKEPPAQAVVELADEINADLIVMGSRGNGPVKRVLLGSVSEGVVHRAHLPVLTLRGGENAWPPEHIVVGEDSSDNARRAGKLAVRLAELFGAYMLLAHVVSLQWMVLKAESQGTNVVDEVTRLAEEHLAEHAQELKKLSGARPHTMAVVGYPALTLAGIAEEERHTLLVVGSRGLNTLKRALLGSVSSSVLRTFEGPVLVVPPLAQRGDSL